MGFFQKKNNRSAHKLGITFSYFGDPFPSLLGANLSYNLGSLMRIRAGYGNINISNPLISSYGAGGILFIPGLNLSPFLSAGWSRISSTWNANVGFYDLMEISTNTSHLYLGVGLDWQAKSGFNLSVGYNYSAKPGIRGLPYVSAGWFF